MPPTGGQGAATAILDAAELTRVLSGVAQTPSTVAISRALQDGTATMRDYAAVAVREALEPVRWITATATPLGRAASAAALPLMAAGASLYRRWS